MPRRRLTLLRLVRDEDAQRSLFEAADFRDAALLALDPDRPVSRYNRVWRLSQPTIEDGGAWLWAKFGFQRRRASQQTYYREDLKDFVTEDGQADQGTFTHFALDLERQYLCVELRPPDIRLASFSGAFNGLLQHTRQETRLTVELVPDVERFERWLEQAQRIDRLRIGLRRPNPSFHGRPEAIRELLEESKPLV
jgi:hypothetical protein